MGNSLLPAEEIGKELKERQNKRLGYKVESDLHKGEMLAADIDGAINALEVSSGREQVDFGNLEQVQARTREYLTACKLSEHYPSVLGLSTFAFGVSRQGLNKYLRLHPDTPTARFIEMTKDLFADVLVNQSLYRNCDVTQVIFQLKNCNGFSDKLEIEATAATPPMGAEPDQQALEQRIIGSIVMED
jgi:hypothetical protein